ncbi:hypothetical protein GOP47_0004714 [Adiantum capillus-veneris]|uniref:Dof-type domain-containing protein n=1 Tax=Adiantum capillus-veneris TaxID=13818 RepID=A0A9D4V969_ADICA|nr:hypothetical protein GOP47_0004714 [Adiantum capillus-veneris]
MADKANGEGAGAKDGDGKLYMVKEPDDPHVIVGYMSKYDARSFYKTRQPTCPRCKSNLFTKFRYFNNDNKGATILQPRYECWNCDRKGFTVFGRLQKNKHQDNHVNGLPPPATSLPLPLPLPAPLEIMPLQMAVVNNNQKLAPVRRKKAENTRNRPARKRKSDINITIVQPQFNYVQQQTGAQYNYQQNNLVYGPQQYNNNNIIMMTQPTLIYGEPSSRSDGAGSSSASAQQLALISNDVTQAEEAGQCIDSKNLAEPVNVKNDVAMNDLAYGNELAMFSSDSFYFDDILDDFSNWLKLPDPSSSSSSSSLPLNTDFGLQQSTSTSKNVQQEPPATAQPAHSEPAFDYFDCDLVSLEPLEFH